MPRGQSATSAVVLLVVLSVVVFGTIAFVGGPFATLLSDPPRVSLETDQTVDAGPNETDAAVVFEHDGGDTLPAEDVFVVVDGERAEDRENLTVRRSSATFEIGERVVVEQTASGGLTGGERLVLVYQRGDSQYRLRAVTVRGADAE